MGYREGLLKGKGEVIQEGFDRGYRLGSFLAVFNILSETLLSNEKIVEFDQESSIDPEFIVNNIKKMREIIGVKVPEIKIATNLYEEI